jgi:hypothetical protein
MSAVHAALFAAGVSLVAFTLLSAIRSFVLLKDDLGQAWLDFAGWQVNYDAVLIALCALTMAPKALWSSDRAPGFAPSLFLSQRQSQDIQPPQEIGDR